MQNQPKTREWAIKLEDLDYTENYADQIETVLKDFLVDDIGYYVPEWIQPILCRSCSGFFPYSNNKGGFRAYQYSDQLTHYFNGTDFEKFNEVCKKTYDHCIEYGIEDKGISLDEFNRGLDSDDQDIISIRDEIESNFGEYESCCFETMMKLEDENTLFISFMLKASDAPYFRSYDECIDIEIKFTNIFELKTELSKVTDRKDVQNFIGLIE